MKRATLTLAILLCLLFCSASVAQTGSTTSTLSKQEREMAIKYMKETKKDFMKSIKGLSEAQWRFKSAPDRWSIAEVSEHIALSEDFLSSIVKDKVMATPAATAEQKEKIKGFEQKVMVMIPDRSKKAQAPEPLRPTNKWATRKDLEMAFTAKRDANMKYIKSTQDDLRAHIMASPIGELDAWQWMIFMAAHSKRHTAQIAEVKTDPNYPKK